VTAPGGVIATVYVEILPAIRDFTGQLRRQIRQSSRELRRLDNELQPVTEAIRQIGLVATGIVPGVRLARTSLLTLGGHAVIGGLLSAAGAAATLSGALITVPALGFAAASGFGALAVGLDGVTKALGKFRDAEKFNELVGELSENAQKTLGVLGSLREEIFALRDSVQDRLFAGLDTVLGDLAGTFLPRIQSHFGNLADIINVTAKDLAAFAQSGQTLADVDGIINNVEAGFHLLRPAIVPAAAALRDVTAVGSQLLPELALEVRGLVVRFSEWISQMRGSGQLFEFMRNGVDALKQVGQIAFNVGSTIASVLGAAQDSGNGLLDTLEQLTGRLAELARSARGQGEIRQFLDSAREAAEALLPVLVSLADLIFNHVVPVLETIAKAVGPAVAEFFTALGDALDVAAPGIEAFAEGFANFVRAIIPALPTVGQFVAELGRLIGMLATRLGPIIAEVATAIGNVLIPILQLLTSIFTLLPDHVLKFIVVIGTTIAVVAGLVTAIRAVQVVIGVFAGAINVLTAGLQRTEGAARGVLGFLGGPWGLVIGAASIVLGLFLSTTNDAAEEQRQLSNAAADLNGVIREQNGVINENVRIKAAQQLREQGILDLANQAGVALNSVTDAYLNQGEALDTLLAQLDAIIAANTQVVHDAEGGVNTAYNETAEAAVELRDKILQLVDARKADANAQSQQQSAAGQTVGLFDIMGTAALGLANAFIQVNDALLRFHQTQLEQISSEIAYFNQLERTRQELNEGTKTLDIHTQEGRDNLTVLTQLAQAGLARIEDLKNQGASTAEVAAATQHLENELISLVQPFFQNRDAARAFLQQIGLLPPSVTVTFYTNLPAILSQIQRITSAISSISGNIFNIGGRARGGPVRPGEWTLVGEQGPELVRWGRAARVFSNDESERMATDVGALDRMTARGPATTGGYGTYGAATRDDPVTVDNQITLQPTVRVYLGDRELHDVVRVEVDRRDRQLRRLITTNTGGRGSPT
jgi:phage-related protein